MASRQNAIDEILRKWDRAREQIKELEARIARYKKSMGEVMDAKETDVLQGDSLKLTRRYMARSYVSKKDLPPDIWERYSTRCSYEAFYLGPIKGKGATSPRRRHAGSPGSHRSPPTRSPGSKSFLPTRSPGGKSSLRRRNRLRSKSRR